VNASALNAFHAGNGSHELAFEGTLVVHRLNIVRRSQTLLVKELVSNNIGLGQQTARRRR
jgi:hypothetical protein